MSLVIVKEFPALTAHRQKKQYTWKITAYESGYTISHGYAGGKVQSTHTEVLVGKAGRSQSEQSILQAQSEYNKKLDRGYSPGELASENGGVSFQNASTKRMVYYPMLCKIFADCPGSVVYPCHTQRKIDGVRAVAVYDITSGTVSLQSRNGKFYNIPFIQQRIAEFFRANKCFDVVLDGELHTVDPSKYAFDTISGICRRGLKSTESAPDTLPVHNPLAEKIQYQMYDLFTPADPSVPFSVRHFRLSCLTVTSENVLIVPCSIANSESDVMCELDIMLNQGHEGVIIRNSNGPYSFGPARSNDIFKLKRFTDSEFGLVSFEEGKGKNKGMPVLVCVTADNKQFKATPDGPVDNRRKMLLYLKSIPTDTLQKHRVTVKYQDLSANGIPRFPIAVGTTFRDQYE